MEQDNRIKLEILFKTAIKNSEEFVNVYQIAEKFLDFLNKPDIIHQISMKHKVNAQSREIQDIFLPKAIELGFESERKRLFKNYQLRPDYYKKLSDKSGVIMEVERGKTLPNNMDLLDVWKCHICEEANYLFLVVPQFRQTKKGTKTDTFTKVTDRIRSFFQEKNYINVDAVFIFGY